MDIETKVRDAVATPVPAPIKVSPKMHEELVMAANWYQNSRGVVAFCGRRTEDALIRRGLITYDTHQPDNYPVITVKGWEYLASTGYKRRAEDPGRLTLEEAWDDAHPAEDSAVPAARTHSNPTTQNTPEEDTLPIDSGPLTERQITLIGHVRAGLRYRAVARELGISEVLVRREAVAIVHKLRCTTITQAIGVYATAQAYLRAADQLDTTSRTHPEQDGVAEDHVNHVLMGLANEYRAAAARLIPQ